MKPLPVSACASAPAAAAWPWKAAEAQMPAPAVRARKTAAKPAPGIGFLATERSIVIKIIPYSVCVSGAPTNVKSVYGAGLFCA